MKLSVIVPIGDFPLYAPCRASLQAAIASVRDEVELVEVDDSAHRGVDWARNEGLRRAKGEYVAWVDSDDEVTADWATEILKACSRGPDVVQCSVVMHWVDVPSRWDGVVPSMGEGALDPVAFATSIIGGYRSGWLVACVFRRSLLQDVVVRGRYYEDYRLYCDVLPRVCSVYGIAKVIYRYNRRRGSLSHYGDPEAVRKAVRGIVADTDQMPAYWRPYRLKATAQMCTDLCWNGVGDGWCRRHMLRYSGSVLLDKRISCRTKIKYVVSLFGVQGLLKRCLR